jgi:Zn-dependent protease
MAFLNLFATLFNLLPVPPLDGYRLIEHRLSHEMQWKMRQPQNTMLAFGLLFMVLWTVDAAWLPFRFMIRHVTTMLGLPYDIMVVGYNLVFFNLVL